MSFNLSALLKARNITSWVDPLLEKGTVYLYQNNQYNYEPEICFRPPGPGTAILEAWGAGGSSRVIVVAGQLCLLILEHMQKNIFAITVTII